MKDVMKKIAVRGVANIDLTAETVFKAGQAMGILLSENKTQIPRILVAKDTRNSGDMFEAVVSAGICSVGAQAMCVGVVPAPAVSYLVKKYKMTGGILVSASRDSMEYNGLEFFDGEGELPESSFVEKINGYISGREDVTPYIATGPDIGRISGSHTAMRDYVDYVKKISGYDFSGIKIAADCANGAIYQSAKLVFKELGADVEMMNNVPTGTNINSNCGIDYTDGIRNFVVTHRCNIGFAFDGDGQSVIAFDENAHPIDEADMKNICASVFPADSEAHCMCSNGALNDALCLAVNFAGAFVHSGKSKVSELLENAGKE